MGRKGVGPPGVRGYVLLSREDPNNEALQIRVKDLNELPPEMLENIKAECKKRYYGVLGYKVVDTRKGTAL